jgi:predicted XRE-type DNA-binding protein
MKLTATSKHREEEPRDVVAITRDGWVATKQGAAGDNNIDCDIKLEGEKEYIQSVMRRLDLTQQELAWILGISRPTANTLANGGRELTLREYFILQVIVDNIKLLHSNEHDTK